MKNSILICLSILINTYGHSQSLGTPSIRTLTTKSVVVSGNVNLQNIPRKNIKNWGVIQDGSVPDLGISKNSAIPNVINETIGQNPGTGLDPYKIYKFRTFIVTSEDKVIYSEPIEHKNTLTNKSQLFDKITSQQYYTIYGHTDIKKRYVEFNTKIENRIKNSDFSTNFSMLTIPQVQLQLKNEMNEMKDWTFVYSSDRITDVVFKTTLNQKDIQDKKLKYRFKVVVIFQCKTCENQEMLELFFSQEGVLLEDKEDKKEGVWPSVSHNSLQGTITGTLGEYRDNDRFHLGTDIQSDFIAKSRSVYAIEDGTIEEIHISGVYNSFVKIGGIYYTHVEVVDPTFVVKETKVKKDQKFGVMLDYNDRTWGVHVHITNGTRYGINDNFLINGYGSFNNNIKFNYNKGGIKFDKTLFFPSKIQRPNIGNPVTWNKEFDNHPILYGKIKIVSNIFHERIDSKGDPIGGALAPFSMGYVVKDTTNKLLLMKNDNITFNKIINPNNDDFKKIHATGSTSSVPYFIISNKLKDGMITDDYFETDKLNDGKVFLILTANGGPDPNKGSVSDPIPIYLDNYKTYIQKIEIKDANNFTRYVAEWSKLINPGDGSVFLVSKNSDPFNKGTKTRMIVYVSEKIPSLNLTMTSPSTTNKPLVTDFVNTDNGLGKKWEKDVVLPNDIPGPTDLSLSFKVISKNLLYGFQENVDNADVKRDIINGNFNDNGSGVDKFHKIKMCPENKDFKITVKPDDEYQNITVSAQGGLPPYDYHIQDMSQPLTGRIAFSSKNVFPVEQAKNYLIRVRDNNACQAEEYYTIERIECDAVTISGGSGITPNNINLGNRSGKITVNWDFYGVPDRMVINYRGIRIFDSNPVSYTGSYSFDHKVEKGSSNIATITIFGPSGTAWTYVVTCPKSTPQTTPLSPNFEENEIDLASKIKIYPNSGKLMFETNNQIPNNEAYFFYRELGELNWNAAGLITFPYEFNHGSKEFEFKFEKVKMSNSDENEKLIIIPNPSTGPVNIHFTSDIIGEVNWSVYDILGKELVNRKEHTQKGLNIFNWNPENARFGVFLVKVQQEGKIFTKKMLFQPK